MKATIFVGLHGCSVDFTVIENQTTTTTTLLFIMSNNNNNYNSRIFIK